MSHCFRFTATLAGLLLIASPTANAQKDVTPGIGKSDGLSLSVRLAKERFRPGEEITLAFAIKNESDKDLFIGDGFLGPEYQEVGYWRHFELHLTDEHKTELQFWSDCLTEGRTSGVRKVFRLKPGHSYNGSIYLVVSGKRQVKFADFVHDVRSGSVQNIKADSRHELGKDGRKYSLTLVYQVHPESHGVWKPPAGFKDELLWKGRLRTAPLEFEIAP
jgi:hypothetical protein